MTVEQHQYPRGMELLTPRQGLAAGAVAAVAMAGVLMAGSALAGQGLWTPLNAIGGFFGRWQPPEAGFVWPTSLVGLVTHLLFGALFGALYASAAERMDRRSVVLVALYYGFMLWFGATFLILSWLKPDLNDVFRSWLFLASHLVYGLVLGSYAAARPQPVRPVSPD